MGVFTKASVLRMSRSLAVCLGGTLGIATVTACVAAWYNEEKDMDTTSMDTLQQRVNVTVTFILGFFVQLNLSRWWDHRSSLKQLHSAVADLLLFLASAGVAQEDLQTVARLGMLSQALLFDEVRGSFRHESQPSAEDTVFNDHGSPSPLVELMRLGLLHADEAVLLDGKTQKAQTVWVWIARYALSLRNSDEDAGGSRSHDHIRSGSAKIQKRCCLGRSAISSIKAQLGTQLPFTYVQLIAMLVQCSHLVMALGCGYTMAAAFGTGRYALLNSQICQVILIPLTFQSLLDVCVYIHDPYGSDILDFSFLHYHVALAKLCDSLITPLPASLSSHGVSRSAATGSGTRGPASSPVSMAASVPAEGMNVACDCVAQVGDELTQGLLNKIDLPSPSATTPAKNESCFTLL